MINIEQQVTRQVPFITRFSPDKPSVDLIVPYVSAEMMRGRANPYLEANGAKPTGMEGYSIGNEINPIKVVKNLAGLGESDLESQIKGARRNEEDRLWLIRSLLNTGTLSRYSVIRERQLELLKELDMRAGNIRRKLDAQISTQGENFRKGTHEALGDPHSLIDYEKGKNGGTSERLIVPLRRAEEDLGIQKKSLPAILEDLPPRLRRGYQYLAELFEKMGNPKVREWIRGMEAIKQPA